MNGVGINGACVADPGLSSPATLTIAVRQHAVAAVQQTRCVIMQLFTARSPLAFNVTLE